MLWGNSSVVVVVVVVAHPDLEMGSSRVLLRNRRFRSARIDPSRLPVAEGYTKNIKFVQNKSNIKTKSWANIKIGQTQAQHNKSPIEISLTPIPLRGLLCILMHISPIFLWNPDQPNHPIPSCKPAFGARDCSIVHQGCQMSQEALQRINRK